MDPSEKKKQEAIVADKLFELLKNETEVYVFAPIKSEIDLNDLYRRLMANQVKLAFPRTKGDDMDFYYIKDLNDLCKGYMNIPEPMDHCLIADSEKAVMIVPGLAFSMDGKRIGYGGGFYDRYFSRYPNIYKIGVAFDHQIDDNIICDEYDVLMNKIIFSQGE